MRVLIIADGPHENASALQTLVERLIESQIEAEHRQGKDAERRVQGIGRFFKKAMASVIDAQREGFDAVVFLIDEDGYPERIEQMTRAQETYSPAFYLARAFGVAIKSFDAWMIADEQALSAILLRTIQRLPSPEREKDPKEIAARLLAESPQVNMRQRDLYAQLAACFRLEILRERCPKGFVPFADRVVRLRQGSP